LGTHGQAFAKGNQNNEKAKTPLERDMADRGKAKTKRKGTFPSTEPRGEHKTKSKKQKKSPLRGRKEGGKRNVEDLEKGQGKNKARGAGEKRAWVSRG